MMGPCFILPLQLSLLSGLVSSFTPVNLPANLADRKHYIRKSSAALPSVALSRTSAPSLAVRLCSPSILNASAMEGVGEEDVEQQALEDFTPPDYAPMSIGAKLYKAALASGPLAVEPFMKALATDPVFLEDFWQKQPLLVVEPLACLVQAFTMKEMKEVVDADFLEAGRGTFKEGKSGWRMATVSAPRGKGFEDAKLRFEDVEAALKERSGTVVVNSAGAYMPPLAGVCLGCVHAWDVPVGINLYITAPGQTTSAPPHTDKQDVFVMQTQGRKRWRVYAPPPPALRPSVDPMTRGKGKDVLSITEMQEPLIDTVLQPGQMLYMPAGFPHTTDTVTNMEDETDPSVHLTVGLDTHVWGLNFAALREYSLKRMGLKDPLAGVKSTSLSPPVYWRLQETIPVGFLAAGIMSRHHSWRDMQRAVVDEMLGAVVQRMQDAEPERWAGKSREEVLAALGDSKVVAGAAGAGVGDTVGAAAGGDSAEGVREVAERLLAHHAKILDIHQNMYADVFYKLAEVPMDLSYFRSKPYFAQLESTMAELVAWADTRSAAAGPKRQEGGGDDSTAAAATVLGKPKGMGMGVAAGKKAGKKGKKKR